MTRFVDNPKGSDPYVDRLFAQLEGLLQYDPEAVRLINQQHADYEFERLREAYAKNPHPFWPKLPTKTEGTRRRRKFLRYRRSRGGPDSD